jgi:hypothetical protein
MSTPAPTKTAPVETKVTVAGVAAFLSSEAVGALTGVIGHGLPAYGVQIITAAVTAVVTFTAAWLARHTPRPSDS